MGRTKAFVIARCADCGGAPQVFGPYRQQDPTCVPRLPPPLDPMLRSAWYDEMLRLMNATTAM